MRGAGSAHSGRSKSATQLRRDESNRVAQSRGTKLDARTYFAAVSLLKREHEARLMEQYTEGLREFAAQAAVTGQAITNTAAAVAHAAATATNHPSVYTTSTGDTE